MTKGDFFGYCLYRKVCFNSLTAAWHFVMREEDGSAEKVLIPNSQLPESGYIRFQVSLFNKHGIGEPKEAEKVEQFYQKWEFLVIIGLVALLIIITITAVLCCYCFRMRGRSTPHLLIHTNESQLQVTLLNLLLFFANVWPTFTQHTIYRSKS